MKRNVVMALAMVTPGLLLMTACGSPTAAVPTAAPTAVPAVAATTQPEVAPVVADTVKVMVSDSSLGKILVADNGMTLYVFTKDTANSPTCYDKCATSWPPLLTKNKPQVGTGADASLLGTTTRNDGTMQVTYNSKPLYFFSKDKTAGDVTGQGVGSVWFALAPSGDAIGAKGTNAVVSTPKASAGTINVARSSIGLVLVDDKGITLYMFGSDTNGTSTCYDQCVASWPPFVVKAKPVAGTGVDGSLLGTTTRNDGSMQVTYKGMPLYYFIGDKAAGDVMGQGIGSVWYVVGPRGNVMKNTR